MYVFMEKLEGYQYFSEEKKNPLSGPILLYSDSCHMMGVLHYLLNRTLF